MTVCIALCFAPETSAWPGKKAIPADTAKTVRDTATASSSVAEPASAQQPVRPTYIDTLNRGREVYLTARDVTPAAAVVVSADTAKLVQPTPSEAYRIQCIASSQLEMIKNEQKNLSVRTKHPLYVMSSPPYYKLLLGDFPQRADAEKVLNEVRGLGYPDAWITGGRPPVKPQ